MSRRKNFSVYLTSPVKSVNPHTGATSAPNLKESSRAIEKTVGVRRRKPDAGWIAPTPYTYERDVKRVSPDCMSQGAAGTNGNPIEPTQWGSLYLGNVYALDSANGTYYALDRIFSSNAYPPVQPHFDRALVKARMAMKGQDVNLGLAFAERNRTAKLVGDTAMQLANSYRSLRKGQWKKAARSLGINHPKKPRGSSVTSRWLELQYGWKPLLSDVYGSVEALAKRDRSDWRVTGKGTSVEPIERTLDTSGELGGNAGVGVAKGTMGVFVRIDAIPQNDPLRVFTSCGITNPAVLAWELVPFSFVVDWFLPIGNYLDSLDAMLGYGPTFCSISTLKRHTVKHKLANTGPVFYNNQWRAVVRKGSARAEYVKLVRTVSNSVPLPTLPRFKNPVSLGHMANGLSLLTQVFGGRR